ncbi:SpoIIE family protein phosphatase [Candidatus Eisenbacteria bacterium]|uniref:SpoIIE family protein phosphatase n=1 Tax=Eiseniibacteriota bacterium TaxID=2212470 RepID=A0ABV6YJ26_UNCEI
MLTRTVKATIVAVAALVVAYTGITYIREATAVVTWSGSGRIYSDVRRDSPNLPVIFNEVDSLDFLPKPCPAVGDTVVAVIDSAGVAASLQDWLQNPTRPGDQRLLVCGHAGGRDTTTVVLHGYEARDLLPLYGLEILRLLINIGYLLVGLWAFARRPDSAGVRALTLFSLSMASLMTTGVHLLPGQFAAFEIPWGDLVESIIEVMTFLMGTFWLLLAVLFPRPLGIIRRHPIWSHIVIFLPPSLSVTLQALGVGVSQYVPMLIIGLSIGTGFWVLSWRLASGSDPLERRQLTLVIYGTGIGLGSLLVLVIIGIIPGLARQLGQLARLAMVSFALLALLLSPASFAYAFGRYRLLEVEGKLRRGSRYALVTTALLVVFVAVLFGVSQLLLKLLQVESRTPTLAVAMLSALGFFPVLRRTHGFVERRVYPERAQLQAILSELLSATVAMPDRFTLWQQLEQKLKQSLGVTRMVPILRRSEPAGFVLADGGVAPLREDSALMRELTRPGGAVLVDEARAAGHIETASAEDAWLEKENVWLLLPMSVRGQLIGALALSFDHEHEDLAAEELSLLVSLAAQVALQSENLRLLEENIEKQHLEEQLAMARKVQERFLPQELPATPGLEVAARCIFSLEVAGDYYDVIPLLEDRTLLAIGDVSGKGAGAALLMANVQASLRALAGVQIKLARAVTQLNDVIYGNTEIGQFITFFAAIYDARSGELEYVNAGHNPPRIIREDGTLEQLEVGGPILGVFPKTLYEQGRVVLQKSDMMIAFTDGVSEAIDDNEIEFSEERIVEIVTQHRDRPVEAFLGLIRQAVEEHSGSSSFADDFTLVAMRVR